VYDRFAAIGSVIGLVAFMILIFAAAYYAAKLMGKHYSMQSSSSRNMRVIDKLQVGRDRFLLIVEAGEKVLLLGISPQHIGTLAELESEGFDDPTPVPGNVDFLSLFKSRLKKPGGQD